MTERSDNSGGNGDYTAMAENYDRIMLRGQYYDYEAIARHLAAVAARRLLELGVGTGLIIEHLLLKYGSDYEAVTGVDMTPAMLAIARDRLQLWPQVDLRNQNIISLDLGGAYDLAFSYGGPCYFVPDGDGSWSMISHIRDDAANARGLARVAAHLAPAGSLLLGIQEPHSNYSRELGDGTTYEQRLSPLPGGFRKRYLLTQDGTPATLVDQTTDYRVFPYAEALGLLSACGLRPVPQDQHHGPMFREFAQP
jgi:SAM-dependent methyltransferase